MIEDVKKVLNKLIEKAYEIDVVYCLNTHIVNKIEREIHSINYKFGDDRFIISPCFDTDSVRIYKNHVLIDEIECSHEDYLEIQLLIEKLIKIYKEKSYNEFIHSV